MKLPTDNLCKFIAAAGLFLGVWRMWTKAMEAQKAADDDYPASLKDDLRFGKDVQKDDPRWLGFSEESVEVRSRKESFEDRFEAIRANEGHPIFDQRAVEESGVGGKALLASCRTWNFVSLVAGVFR